MDLVIVESPTKAKTISRFLGTGSFATSLVVIFLGGLWPSLSVAGPLIEGNAALSVDASGPKNRAINDWEFAESMRGLLVDETGTAKVRAAIFLFATCYGGGMLDDLEAAFRGTTLRWVAGAAGSPKQNSFGQDSSREHDQKLATARRASPPYKEVVLAIESDPNLKEVFVSPEPLPTWTRSLLPALTDSRLTVREAMQQASRNDAAGAGASDKVKQFIKEVLHQTPEAGISTSGNEGDALKIADPAAKSYHAILWSGLDNRERFRTSKQLLRSVLDEQWRAGAENITFQNLGIASGKGVPPATRQELAKAIASVGKLLGPDEVFLFYATGHGEFGNSRPQRRDVPPGQQSFFLELPEELLTGLAVYQPSSSIDISYRGLDSEIPVLFNGALLGSLIPRDSNEVITASFPVDRHFVSLRNEVLFQNSGAPFTLEALEFFPGQCCDFAIVPVPPTLLLMGLAIAAHQTLKRLTRKRAR